MTVSDEMEEGVVVTALEQRVKYLLALGYRSVIALLLLNGLFYFFFSPIWLHGYVWSLNQNYTRVDLQDQSEGLMHTFQLLLLPRNLRLCLLALFAISLILFLKSLKIKRLKIWQIFQLCILLGMMSIAVRGTQEKRKIFPDIHEGFYYACACFSVLFVIMLKK